MAWVRLDDAYYDHGKFATAGPLAELLWVRALAWANRNLTDGHLPRPAVVRLASDLADVGGTTWDAVAGALVDAGLWDVTEAGWAIHDYLEFQPSAAKVKAEREARSAQRSQAARARWDRAADASPHAASHAARNANAMRERCENDAPTPTPTPTPSEQVTTTSTLGDVRAREGVGGFTNDPRIGEAIERLVAAEEREARQAGTPPRSPKAWRARVRTRLVDELGPVLTALAAADPGVGAATLAARATQAQPDLERRLAEIAERLGASQEAAQ